MVSNFLNFITSREFITFLGVIALLAIVILIFIKKKLSIQTINFCLIILFGIAIFISLRNLIII